MLVMADIQGQISALPYFPDNKPLPFYSALNHAASAVGFSVHFVKVQNRDSWEFKGCKGLWVVVLVSL